MLHLATVNSKSIDVIEVIRRSIKHDDDFLRDAVEELLIREYAEKEGIFNTDEELQVAADELRYQRGLESVEKLNQWLKNKRLTILSVENGIDYQLLCNKVRKSISDSEVEAYFLEHKLDFEKVDLYSIRLDTKEKAEELYARITDEGENFHVLAMEYSLDEQNRPKGGYVGKVSRDDLSAEIESAVFNVEAGEVISPIKTEKGYNLFKVTAFYPANLDDEKEKIRFELLKLLIARLRAEATISYPLLEEDL